MAIPYKNWLAFVTFKGIPTLQEIWYLLPNNKATLQMQSGTYQASWDEIDDTLILKTLTPTGSVFVSKDIFCGFIMFGVMTNFSNNGNWFAFPYTRQSWNLGWNIDLKGPESQESGSEFDPAEFDPEGNKVKLKKEKD
jgi:hypothetical protein